MADKWGSLYNQLRELQDSVRVHLWNQVSHNEHPGLQTQIVVIWAVLNLHTFQFGLLIHVWDVPLGIVETK